MKEILVGGIDVSKRFSDLCVLSPQNTVLVREKIYHDITSMQCALKILQGMEQEYGHKPILVMESTSHYHLLLHQFFSEAGFEVIVVNPLQSSSMKNFEIRKRKTDKVDARRLAMLYQIRVLRTSQIPQDAIRGLRLLCRQRAELMTDITRYKNRLTALLDQIFPGYDKIFSDVGGVSSRAVLRHFPTPAALVCTNVENIAEVISAANGRGAVFAKTKADRLKECAMAAQKIGLRSAGDPSVIHSLVTMLDSLYTCKKSLEDAMQKLIVDEPSIHNNIALLCSIPGIGKFSAAVILAELGDISLFHKPKQLSAYFGLDPSERQSGTFTGTKNKLSKRGSPYARAALHMAAHNAICKHGKSLPPNPILADYYEKKCKAKPNKVALAAVMHKLTNIIFAVLRDQKPFELRKPEEHARHLGMLYTA